MVKLEGLTGFTYRMRKDKEKRLRRFLVFLRRVLTVIVQESGNNRGNTAEMIASELVASSLCGLGKEV